VVAPLTSTAALALGFFFFRESVSNLPPFWRLSGFYSKITFHFIHSSLPPGVRLANVSASDCGPMVSVSNAAGPPFLKKLSMVPDPFLAAFLVKDFEVFTFSTSFPFQE